MPDPAVSILIPAYNEATLLGLTLDSVHASFTAIGFSAYEIVVCDNNSTDATAEIARSKMARVVFESHNQIARARNTAARDARGKWLIFLDADTLLNPPVLRETIDALASKRTGAGGSLLKMEGENLGRGAACAVATWNKISVFARLAAGSYIFCEQLAWRDTNGFDETLYASEEIWFSRKLKHWCRQHQVGFKIITTAPVVTSARKVHWYGLREHLKCLFSLAMPGALRNRDKCDLWYKRPQVNPETPVP